MDKARRTLRAFGLVVAMSAALVCIATASPAMAEDNVVCVELPYDGPPLPVGVEIGTALRCEVLDEPAAESGAAFSGVTTSGSDADATTTARTSTLSRPAISLERHSVPAQPEPETRNLVPASKLQNESASAAGPTIGFLALGLALLLTLRIGWSFVAHRRATSVTIAAN